MSELVPLLARLKESGAERVFFAPNEQAVVHEGDAKRAMPGRPVNAAMLLEAVSELLSQDDIDGLSTHRPRIVRYEHDGEDFVLEIVRYGQGVALGIRHAARAGRLREPAGKLPPVAPPRRNSRRMRSSTDLVPSLPPAQELVKKPTRRSLVPSSMAPERAAREASARETSGSSAQSTPKIDVFLREMIAHKASDLHLSSGTRPVLRVDGEIRFGTDRPVLASAEILAMVHEIMPARAREDFEALGDADFAYEVAGLARFRVNVFQDRHGTGAVLRQIPIEILSAEQLGLPKACLDLCWLSKGLVLVTGPTGSGKSTTLAAMIDFINKNRADHIITIEDPVEFVHENKKCLVNQREVGEHTKSFKNALRAALREDPDIVLVGELRDLETIAIAIETAETGHLVFGTLHTTTAISTVDRLIDQFPADRQQQIRVMLSESLKGVIAQLLCPRIGGGRVAAHEILLGSHAVASMIREGKTFQLASVMQTSKNQGMVTMNDSLMSLVQRRLVDPKQAYLEAVDKNGFANMLRAAGLVPPV